ncbi:hypothetical protein MMC17_008130 [Xylographa soralifera]|nr:hypothetical protein [Xylographa soralifera]
MQDSQFPIPEEFRSEVHYVESYNKQSDEDILASLTKHVSITSEKNIWTFWHSGVSELPGWCQRNVINWIRLNDPSWTVRVLDSIPGSLNNALKWVDKEMLPETFVNSTMDGPYVGPHSADFLRGACLYLYGGVWMDVGIILIRQLSQICWGQLEDPQSPFEVSVPWMYGRVMANHFVAARKGNPFIRRWHDIFVHLWKDRTNPGGIIMNPLVAFAQSVKFEDSQLRGFKWDFKVSVTTVMDYIGQVMAWLRISMLEDPHDGFNGADYYSHKILLFDALSEDWAAETLIGFKGQDLFDVLATRRDADPDSEEYRKAYHTIWRLLTKSSMQKITHGKDLTTVFALGMLLDMEGNEMKDVEPGTYAELLRYGSVHFEQERKTIDYVRAEAPEVIIRKGLLEA